MDEYESPNFPAREMYSNVPGPVLLSIRAKCNAILIHNFTDSELNEFRMQLRKNDPVPDNNQ